MTFLAPWALALGALGAAGAVLLHLVARQRPAAFMLPTARFIPDRQTLVSRAATRPTDLVLLALRVLLLLAAGAAFARPVFVRAAATHARIVLLDRSSAVADVNDAWRRARALGTGPGPTVVIAFDSATAVVDGGAADSPITRSVAAGSISAALIAARRAAGSLATRADSVELVLVSPIATEELDAATAGVRALWPGGIRLERVALRSDSSTTPTLERALPMSDALGPAMAARLVRAEVRAVRLRRANTLDARDSAYAAAGGTVVLWDSSAAPLRAEGLALGDDVIVARLGRRSLAATGAAVARWADGSAAARERPIGAGCLRAVGIALPTAGDLPLRAGFQRIVRGLLAPCGRAAPLHAADSTMTASVIGGKSLAPASTLRSGAEPPSPFVPWLLGVALLCALAELALRGRRGVEAGA